MTRKIRIKEKRVNKSRLSITPNYNTSRLNIKINESDDKISDDNKDNINTDCHAQFICFASEAMAANVISSSALQSPVTIVPSEKKL